MKNKNKKTYELHTPVLASEVLQVLEPKKGEHYLDLTAGYGGHARLVLEQTDNYAGAVLCDRDKEAIDHVYSLFGPQKTEFVQNNFSAACDDLLMHNRQFDMILADLGVSSPHLDKAERGFSVLKNGPLDMRMDQSTGRSAMDILNGASEKEIETILRTYGEEPKARRIAHAIMLARPLEHTTELAELIKSVYGKHTKHHPAVKSFQALRIAVNDELGLLSDMLPKAVKLLAPGGRLGVITFHSLEDRIVKQYFAGLTSMGYEAEVVNITKKPLAPGAQEISFNPRARSAKLRAVLKK
jgi:16S rRNA (cytosine1402-N4)-methyltransferase